MPPEARCTLKSCVVAVPMRTAIGGHSVDGWKNIGGRVCVEANPGGRGNRRGGEGGGGRGEGEGWRELDSRRDRRETWTISAKALPTGTSALPSGTRILASTPSSCASKASVALSVSISHSTCTKASRSKATPQSLRRASPCAHTIRPSCAPLFHTDQEGIVARTRARMLMGDRAAV